GRRGRGQPDDGSESGLGQNLSELSHQAREGLVPAVGELVIFVEALHLLREVGELVSGFVDVALGNCLPCFVETFAEFVNGVLVELPRASERRDGRLQPGEYCGWSGPLR